MMCEITKRTLIFLKKLPVIYMSLYIYLLLVLAICTFYYTCLLLGTLANRATKCLTLYLFILPCLYLTIYLQQGSMSSAAVVTPRPLSWNARLL